MRVIYAILMLIMLVFAGLQYNDKDGLYWAIIYIVPAIALGFAAFMPHRLATWTGRILMLIALITLGFGVYVYWPTEPRFWQRDVWWDNEPVKEGLGVAIAYLFTCAAIPLCFRSSKARAAKKSRRKKH